MTKYIVTGGQKLSGTVSLSGAKNAGFKLMIASLLGDSPSQISNLGLISEIDLAKENINSLGGNVLKCGGHCLEIDPRGLKKFEISKENGEKSRSCTMYIPALLHRFGKAIVPLPGGDRIAARPLERHFEGLKAMGAIVDLKDGVYVAGLQPGIRRLHGANYHFEKNTHTGTETLIMAATKADGQTILENCATDPEIDNMINFLNRMGGKITRKHRTIYIEGVEKLTGTAIEIIPDRNEAVTFACIALGTKGDVLINGASEKILGAFINGVKNIGGGFDVADGGIRFYFKSPLNAIDLETAPYPGFMTDWQPLWTTLMTQAQGTSIVHETIHESRFGFVPLLEKMGAKIELFRPKVYEPDKVYNFNLADDKPDQPHAARIFGPTPLSGTHVETKDLRAGATMMMAGLMASGQSVISDPLDQIKRGYENLPGKLISLGALIEVVE